MIKKHSSTEDQSVELHVLKPTHFTGGDVSFHGNDVSEIHIVNGSMKGDEIDVQVRSIETERILLSSVRNNKRMIGSNMALVDEDGTIQRGHIPINQDGSMGDFKVSGTVDFIDHQQPHLLKMVMMTMKKEVVSLEPSWILEYFTTLKI